MEYTIKHTKDKITLFKSHRPSGELTQKPNYIESTFTQPPLNLLKQRTMHYKPSQKAFGTHVPKLYIGQINHTTRTVLMSEVDLVYKFAPKHDTQSKGSGLGSASRSSVNMLSNVVLKNVSKEEFEHRKKSANYQLNRIENNEGVFKRYIRDCSVEMEIEDVGENEEFRKTFVDERVCRAILNARIVNFKELVCIFSDEEAVRTCLGLMTSSFCGRFVLKNKFYEPILRKKRDNILQSIAKNIKGRSNKILKVNVEENNQIYNLNIKECENIRKEEDNTNKIGISYNPTESCIINLEDLELDLNDVDVLMLIKEIAMIKNKCIILKGYYEDYRLDEKKVDLREIIKKDVIVSLDRLCKQAEMEEDEIFEILRTYKDVERLCNNTFVLLEEKDDEIKKAVVELLKEKNILKRKDVLQSIQDKTGKEVNMFSVNKFIKEYCITKGSSYVLKNGN